LTEKTVTDKDYLFLSAMLKAREPYMMSYEKMERMLSCETYDETARVLLDCGHEDMSGMDARGVDLALARFRKSIFDEVLRFAPEPGVVDAFRMKYDYHNAKVLVKAEGAGTDGEHILSDAGRVAPEKLTDAFHDEDYRFIPAALGKALEEAKSVLARTQNPQLADFVLYKAYFQELLDTAAKRSSPYLARYTRTLIDSANLRICVRSLRMGRDQEFLKSALIPGGNVSADRLAQTVLSGDEMAAAFAATPFKEAAILGNDAIRGGTLTRFELVCDNAVIAFLTRSKTVGFGSEVVVGYLAAVETGIVATRMILTGLLAGISPEQIKERLRDTYA
jgi:V/A-type H+-transporting ATPase subunit C